MTDLTEVKYVLILILIFVIMGDIHHSIIVGCLFLLCKYTTMSSFNPNRSRHKTQLGSDGFGNSHEYEMGSKSTTKVNDSTAKGAWQNFRRMKMEEKQYLQTLQNDGISGHRKQIETMVDDMLYPRNETADDRLAKFASHNARKSKKSLEYRSGMTKDKFSHFFQNELDLHEHRDWWSDPRDEYSDKHVVF